MKIVQKLVAMFRGKYQREDIIDEPENSNIKSPRRELYEFMFTHALGDNKKLAQMYENLYSEFQKKCGINLQKLSVSRGCRKTIDYAEQEGYIHRLLKLAKSMYSNQASQLIKEFGCGA